MAISLFLQATFFSTLFIFACIFCNCFYFVSFCYFLKCLIFIFCYKPFLLFIFLSGNIFHLISIFFRSKMEMFPIKFPTTKWLNTGRSCKIFNVCLTIFKTLGIIELNLQNYFVFIKSTDQKVPKLFIAFLHDY